MPRKQPPRTPGETAISSAIDAAEPVSYGEPPAADDAPRVRTKKVPSLPPSSPVTPLGILGDEFFVIDSLRQFVRVEASGFGANGVSRLFARRQAMQWLQDTFPRHGKGGNVQGIDKEAATQALITACGECGIFDPDQKIRAVGAWTDSKGRLLWHLGDKLLVCDGRRALTVESLGLFDGHVYPRGPAQPSPVNCTAEDAAAAAGELLAMAKTWNWSRGELDARLLVGWLGCSLIGGALTWRPAIWVTGGSGTGKSTLQELVIEPVLGGKAAVCRAQNASGAGIWQSLGHKSTPVLVDELEAKADNRQVLAVVELMRITSSGGRILRGGSDHGAREFTARSTFEFSSVLRAPLEPQDISRLLLVDLLKLPDVKILPARTTDHMHELGRKLRRALALAWQVWPQLLEQWRQGMVAQGFGARQADTFGTTLAMQDLMLHTAERLEADGVAPPATVAKWCEELAPHLRRLLETSGEDHDRCIRHLLTWSLDPWQKGMRLPIEVLLSRAAGRPPEEDLDIGELSEKRAQTALAANGIKVVRLRDEGERSAEWYVAIAEQHQGINRIFRHTKWGDGVYAQSLGRAFGARPSRQRFGTHRFQCVVLPLTSMIDPGDGDGEVRTPRPPAPPVDQENIQF